MHRVISAVASSPLGDLLQAIFISIDQHDVNARTNARRERLIIFYRSIDKYDLMTWGIWRGRGNIGSVAGVRLRSRIMVCWRYVVILLRD